MPKPSTLLAAAALAACTPKTPVSTVSSEPDPVMVAPWTGPFGGVPPFDQVDVGRFEADLRLGMARELANAKAIAANPEPATFANTLVAMETMGEDLERVDTLYGVWSSCFSSPELREIEAKLAPEMSAHRDAIRLDPALFARVKAVYDARDTLSGEDARLAEVTYRRFVRAGAALSEDERARITAINQELSSLYTSFSQNLLADEEAYVLVLEASDLDGLPASYLAGAAAAAEERGHPGKHVVTNTRSSMEPFLVNSTRRDLREKGWRTYVNRGDNGDAHDNNALIPKILTLRAERAKLLGYPTHAHLRLDDAMAKTPENALALMESVWPAAVARVREEVADMQALADAEAKAGGAKITIEPWDYRFYAEKVRKERYALDQAEVMPYLQLEKLREGMFWAVGELYGWRFEPVEVPVPHADVRVWEVKGSDGAHVGLFYFDPFARPGKRSGAWMNAYRVQDGLGKGSSPIVSNNANFVKGAPGEPVLITWDDAETLFHEFGHAIHGLASDVTYPSLAGTNVARDFVEFPSQLNEHWLGTTEVLSRFALHAETGEPMPAELLERIEAAATFNQGFGTTEYLASALIDMKLHLAEGPVDPDAFERDTLNALGMPKELVMRHRTPQFGHVFSGDGYSAGYYSYLWSDTLTADAAEAFHEGSGLYDTAVAKRYLDTVISRGNTQEPAAAWKAFRGRDVSTDALLRDRGFPVPPG